MVKRALTFVIDGIVEDDFYWLAVDANEGEPETIAFFSNKAAADLFTEALNMAKLAAHEAGRQGL